MESIIDTNALVHEMGESLNRELEKMLRATPVGMVLCVHDPFVMLKEGTRLDVEEGVHVKMVSEAHIMTKENALNNMCDAKGRRTQYFREEDV